MVDQLIHKLEINQTSSSSPTLLYRKSHFRFLLFNVIFVLVFFAGLRALIVSTWNSSYVTYVPFIPVIVAWLLYSERRKIYSHEPKITVSAIIVIVLGTALYSILILQDGAIGGKHSVRFALITMALVMVWLGGYLFWYGPKVFKAALFPLLFLLFAIPLPQEMLDTIIAILQRGSAEISFLLIKWSGIPVVRDGFVFHLSTMNIEVAPQCSGIRSSLSLVIVGSLAAYLFLRKGCTRAMLIATLLPIAVVKNGLRIAVLTLLSVYVDPSFLEGDLHQRGGVPFFILALLMTGGVIALLRKGEGEGPQTVNGKAEHGDGS